MLNLLEIIVSSSHAYSFLALVSNIPHAQFPRVESLPDGRTSHEPCPSHSWQRREDFIAAFDEPLS